MSGRGATAAPVPGPGSGAVPAGGAHDRTVLLFSLGGRRYAARAADVRRIARRDRDELRFVDASLLGSAAGARGLVAAFEGGEAALAVDEVEGVHARAQVHALPALAQAVLPHGAIAGLVEDGSELLPLIDLPALLARRIAWEENDGGQRDPT